MAGTLYVVATPIGNLEDMTIRGIRILRETEVIACEDTRHTGILMKVLGEKYGEMGQKRYISVRDFNEMESVGRILQELSLGDVALVSDAGTPLLSDPGFKIVRATREAGFKVTPIPGAFAGATALSAAGLPTNKFLFWGFLPKKWELEAEITHVIYESPLRAQKTIEKILEKYPTAKIMVAKELTKIHESIEEYKPEMKFKGEVSILVYWA